MHWRLLILLVPLVNSGCASPIPWTRAPQLPWYNRNLDDFVSSQGARDVARQHMHTLYEPEPGGWPTRDFQAGFEQAYADVALGANGQVPVMAPSPYWRSCQRTAEGHQRAQEWLSGYSIGASHALACRGPYNKVIASGSAGPCPPRNVSGCGPGHPVLAASDGPVFGQTSSPTDTQVIQTAAGQTPH